MQLESFSLGKHDALIIVDLQNDFLPGGALGVPDGDAVIAPRTPVSPNSNRRALPSSLLATGILGIIALFARGVGLGRHIASLTPAVLPSPRV